MPNEEQTKSWVNRPTHRSDYPGGAETLAIMVELVTNLNDLVLVVCPSAFVVVVVVGQILKEDDEERERDANGTE